MSPKPEKRRHQRRLLAVFAHPDDEVFCAGGLLARWTASGEDAMVISATRGEAGQIQDARVATRPGLGAAREQELRTSCRRLGVHKVKCLDYRDGTLRDMDGMTLARSVAAHIREYEPDVIVTFGADGGYGHPDHMAISAATTLACRLVAHEGMRTPALFYSEFPRQRRLICQRLADWLVRRGSGFRGSTAFVRALTLLADEATMLRYAEDAVETQWFPADFSIIEQGELSASLYLIVCGHAVEERQDADGTRRILGRLGPGQFFGEQALARRGLNDVSVRAVDTVTCLKLSSRGATKFDGRGGGILPNGDGADSQETASIMQPGLLEIDVSTELTRKLAALAAHRSQFAFEPTMFPPSLLDELLGREYFQRVTFAAASGEQLALIAEAAPREVSIPA